MRLHPQWLRLARKVQLLTKDEARLIAANIAKLCAASDCRPRAVQLRGAAYPALKRLKDDSVSFRSMKLQKFHYCCIEFCSHFCSPALLTHGQPSALKRSKSAFLLVGHGPLISALPTPAPHFV